MDRASTQRELAVDEATNRLFVLVEHATDPNRLDLVEYELSVRGQHELRRITLDRQVSVPAALAVDDRVIYVCNNGPGGGGSGGQEVTVVDRATFTLRGPIPLPQMGLAQAVSTSQRVLHVGTSSWVRTYETDHLQPLGRTPLPGGQLKVSLGLDDPSGAVLFSGSDNPTISAAVPPYLG